MRFDWLSCRGRSEMLASTVTLGLLVASSAGVSASDAAAELADRFAGPSQRTAPIVQQMKATPEPPDTSAARVKSVLDNLRERIETSDRGTVIAPEVQPAAAPPRDTQPLRGNDIFGDGRERQPRVSEPRSVTSWARPSMERHGESLDAAPIRPAGPIERVSILLMMKPGKRGIRRFNKTADPIVCVASSCFISRGPSDAARTMNRRKAFGTINTLGKRAGACQNRQACIFRDIRLDGGRAEIQPIDLRLVRHDRRERAVVTADRTCGIFRGRLTCANAVESETYTAWIVPEDVAVEAGVRALETALRTRLSGPTSAALQN